MNRLVFVDTETTGLDPREHQVWEIALILRNELGMPDDEHVWQIRPDLDRADPVALEKSRFHERFLVPDSHNAVKVMKDGGLWKMPIHEALFDIQDILRDSYMVGAVPSFDDAFLKALLRTFRIQWKHRLICVETLVAGALKQPVPLGLRKAAEAMGVKVDGDVLHTALGDARLARDVYDAVMGGAA